MTQVFKTGAEGLAKNLGFELFPFLGLCTSEREKAAEYSQTELVQIPLEAVLLWVHHFPFPWAPPTCMARC